MKIYIASKTKHANAWREIGRAEITSTWIYEAGEGERANYSELAIRCLREIESADFLLLYCEPEEFLKGALIEAGAALALGKQVRCVGTSKSLSRVFNEHPLWRQFNTVKEALDAK